MPNGTCHGCAQALHEFISEAGQKRLEAKVKNMAPWPIGKGQMGAIRHQHIEPESPCNGIIWFYNDDPTPPGGEAYMSWFSNPIVNKAVQTFGGAPPPKPRPIEQALFHSLDATGEILQTWEVTQDLRQLVKDNSCYTLTIDRTLRDVLVERGALANPEEGLPPEAEGVSTPETTSALVAALEPAPEAEPQLTQEVALEPSARPAPEPAPDSEPEPVQVADPAGAKLTVFVDGVSHDFDGLQARLNIRKALQC